MKDPNRSSRSIRAILNRARFQFAAVLGMAVASLASHGAVAGVVEPFIDAEVKTASIDGDAAYQFPGFGATGLTVHRIFVDGLLPGDGVSAVFGDTTTPATISNSSGPFFNGPNLGQGHGRPDPDNFQTNPSLQWDTWLAIDESMFSVSPGFPGIAVAAGTNIVANNNMAWYVIPAAVTTTGRVLIGQFAFAEGSNFEVIISLSVFRNGFPVDVRNLHYVFSPPGDLTGACCVAGACEEMSAKDCAGAGGVFSGEGSDCGSVNCEPPPDPVGACCVLGECAEMTAALCSLSGGVYHGDGVLCSSVQCEPPPDPVGACCIMGECAELTAAFCSLSGGVYQGDGVTCASVQCGPPPDPVGACCVSGQCVQVTEAQCAAMSGTFTSVGTPCSAEICTPPDLTGACCVEGNCVEVTAEICAVLGSVSNSVFHGVGTSCSDVQCEVLPPPTGACCVAGSCARLTAEACGLAGGTYSGDGSDCGGVNCSPPTGQTGACCVNGACTTQTAAACASAGGSFFGEGSTCDQVECEMPAAVGTGCNFAFWKTSTPRNRDYSHWPAQYQPNDPLATVFTIPACISDPEIHGGTLLTALQFGGGSGVDGAARQLLKDGVAALLNARLTQENRCNAQFPIVSPENVINIVNHALAKCDRQQLQEMARKLTEYNNLGCPMSGRGDCK